MRTPLLGASPFYHSRPRTAGGARGGSLAANDLEAQLALGRPAPTGGFYSLHLRCGVWPKRR